MGLILLDLDHFKKLNDNYGHLAGDEALRRVGRCLDSIVASPALAARYGGEEFGIVLSQVTADAVRSLAEEIRRGVERIEFEHNGRPVRITASLGAAHVHFAHETATAGELIERADGCLYEAKRKGRNRVEITF
jgi:diguanylate cyclase (GGDEF)-like protein